MEKLETIEKMADASILLMHILVQECSLSRKKAVEMAAMVASVYDNCLLTDYTNDIRKANPQDNIFKHFEKFRRQIIKASVNTYLGGSVLNEEKSNLN